MKLDKPTEPLIEGGLVRARVKLELQDLESKDIVTWRGHWPQEQPWRSLSWRARNFAQMRREEEEEAEVLAIEAAQREEARLVGAAVALESASRAMFARKRSRIIRNERAAEKAAADALAAAEAAEAAEAAAEAARKGRRSKDTPGKGEQSPTGKGKTAKSPPGKGKGAGKGDAKEASTAKGSPTKGSPSKASKPAGAPAPAPAAEKAEKKIVKEEAKVEPDKDAAAPAEDKGEKKGSPEKQVKKPGKKEAKKKAQAKEVAEKSEPVMDEELAATKVQALIRGKSARRSIREGRLGSAAAPAASDAVAHAANKGGEPVKPKAKKSRRGSIASIDRRASPAGSSERRSSQAVTSGIDDAMHPGAIATGAAGRREGSASPPQSRVGSPRPTLYLENARQDMYGWVTLASETETFVIKEVGRLPMRMRQQQLQLWNRSALIDSERERERALYIGEANEAAAAKTLRMSSVAEEGTDATLTAVNTTRRQYVQHEMSKPTSPRSPYADLVRTRSDGVPRRNAGFAYGGVHPGKKSNHSAPVEAHEVRYSIGTSGSYLLYVALRKPNAGGTTRSRAGPSSSVDDWQVSGSPFLLTVAPGKAFALSTSLTSKSFESLRGGPEKDANDRFSCKHVLLTCDKTGNPCESGGANVTCGFLGADTSEPAPATVTAEEPGATGSAGKKTTRPQTAGAPAASKDKPRSSCDDQGDGTYKLQWSSSSPGTFTVYVKVDGLHVIGSPARMVLVPGVPLTTTPPGKRSTKAATPAPKKAAGPGATGAHSNVTAEAADADTPTPRKPEDLKRRRGGVVQGMPQFP